MLLPGLLGLVVLYFFMLVIETSGIENQLQRNVLKVLIEAGYPRLNVSVRGRDIVLEGHVSSLQAQQKSILLAAGVNGVRIAKTRATIREVRLPHVKISRSRENEIRTSGELPDQLLVHRIGQDLGAISVAEISVDPELSEADWIPAIVEIFDIGQGLDNFEFELGAGTLVFGGITDDPAVYLQTLDKLNLLATKFELKVSNRLATVE